MPAARRAAAGPAVTEQVRRDQDRAEAGGSAVAHRVPEAVVDAERVQQDDRRAHARSRGGSRGAPSGGGVPAAFMVMARVV